ncbi:hypothetical protein KAH94_00350 [bacterium]|nr:hypothetical protein [bacterium]
MNKKLFFFIIIFNLPAPCAQAIRRKKIPKTILSKFNIVLKKEILLCSRGKEIICKKDSNNKKTYFFVTKPFHLLYKIEPENADHLINALNWILTIKKPNPDDIQKTKSLLSIAQKTKPFTWLQTHESEKIKQALKLIKKIQKL